MTNKAVFRAFWGTVYGMAFRIVESLPGNGSSVGAAYMPPAALLNPSGLLRGHLP